MAKDSDKLRGGLDIGETGGAFSGFLAEEDEFDRRALWRLGTWAVVSVAAVTVAVMANQSSLGVRREQTASADLLKQAQQLQLTARESQNESRRLASAVDTLNSDRDRLYSRVAVLEQGLDSVTGAITRQSSVPPQAATSQTGANQTVANQANAGQGNASATTPSGPSASQPASVPSPVAAAPTTSAPPTATASAPVDLPAPATKPSPASTVGPVAAPAVLEKQDKQVSAAPLSEPSPAVKPAAAQQAAPVHPSGSLVASKSMMAPPDAAAGKLIEPNLPSTAVNSAPPPEVVAVAAPKAAAEPEPQPAPAAPELTVRRTEFGVDIGGANSIPGLRALWRGLLKSKANAALTKLHPIIVVKENTNGLGMQLRLVAGPISDAAAAAKICASLTVSDRSCSTAVFEGQRLTVNADEADKPESGKGKSEAEADSKPPPSKPSGYRHSYAGRHPKVEEPPKPEPPPSTMSLIFGRH